MPSPTTVWLETRAEIKRLRGQIDGLRAGDPTKTSLWRMLGIGVETLEEQLARLERMFASLPTPPGYEEGRKAIVTADGHVEIPLPIEKGGGYIHEVGACPACLDAERAEFRNIENAKATLAPGDPPR